MKFIHYTAVVLALFGPKYGFFDSRLLLFPILLMFYGRDSLFFTKDQLILLGIILFLLLYSFVLFILFPANPEFLRYFRSFISLFCLSFILRYNNSFESALSILVNVLILHPLAIYFSIVSPSIQVILAKVFQFVAENRDLRYNGLTAGFDIAGYLSISGFLICLFIFYRDNKVSSVIKALVFFISVFFTSRTSIVVLLFVSTLLFFQFLVSSKFSIKKIFFGGVLFTVTAMTVYEHILPNFISTIEIELFADLSEKGNDEAVLTYAKTDPVQMLIDFIILPKSIIGLFFGENVSPLSDSGYIQTINAVGLLGLFISLLFYCKMYIKFKYNDFNDLLKINMLKALRMIIIITLLLCIKNQYLFTRGTFELVAFMYMILSLPSNVVAEKRSE